MNLQILRKYMVPEFLLGTLVIIGVAALVCGIRRTPVPCRPWSLSISLRSLNASREERVFPRKWCTHYLFSTILSLTLIPILPSRR